MQLLVAIDTSRLRIERLLFALRGIRLDSFVDFGAI